MTVKEKIQELFKTYNELGVKEITDRLQVSKQMAHLAINKLVDEKKIEKLGRTPKTVYRLIVDKKDEGGLSDTIEISQKDKDFLSANFLIVTESGNLLEDIEAFDYWCKQRKLPTAKALAEFITTKKKYEPYYDEYGNINGINKLKNTKGYEQIWLDQLYYLDFYAIELFGKTRLGTLLHYAKQGQNKYLMSIMLGEISERIREFVKREKADAIGYVPPTIRREVQLMKFLQTHLELNLPLIEVKKISGIIPVPQKSLSKLDERIRNAENTFAVTERRSFQHLVLIDDAVGSGATLNQISSKVKAKGVAGKVTGLAIVGSFKGFDVIADV